MIEYQSLEGVPLVAKNDYTAYVEYVETVLGGRREQLTLDENYTKIVVLTDVAAGVTAPMIDIRCPAGQKFSIMGTQQIPRGADARSAHAYRMRAADTSDAETSFASKVRVTKEGITDSITNIARVYYGDVSLTKIPGPIDADTTMLKTDLEWYRWKQGIELNGEQHLIISAITPTVDVDHGFITFAADMDIW